MNQRTKEVALEALLSNRQEIVRKIQDPELAELLSERLVRSVFEEAWRLQFEDDVQQFQRAVRDLVIEAADGPTP